MTRLFSRPESAAAGDPGPQQSNAEPASSRLRTTRGRSFAPGAPAARRTLLFLAVAASLAAGAFVMYGILQANGFTWIEAGIFVLFVINFSWILLSFWTAVIGFVIRMTGRDPINLRPLVPLSRETPTEIRTRTAILVPVYNEDPRRVFSGLEAMYRSLAPAGGLRHFDCFVLSDTTRDEIAAEERRWWADCCRRLEAEGRIFYRRRPKNVGKKAGNIADFCQRWGAHYEHMIVLDADSLMEGASCIELVRLMQANPQAGLIQSAPMPVNQTTLFARVLQFTSRLVGPVLSDGVAFWYMGAGNYWGHNAIIRTRAFSDNCGLPKLPGKPPFGGEILSHDYVEAALLRRGGWRVYFVPDLGGSYEELPSNIIDYAVRDRRWCQGNLQHLRLLGARGFHSLSRLHLFSGALAYLTSPLWVLLLVLSTTSIIDEAITGVQYFRPGYSLFPEWPISKLYETISLFLVTIALLLLPKLFGLLAALFDNAERRAFGGAARLSLSLFLETLFSMLISPVMAGLHTYFVLSLLLGRAVGWNPQNRSERGLTVGEAFSSLGIFLAIGVAWFTLIWSTAPDYLWWLLPVIAGLMMSIPVAVLSSRVSVGEWTMSQGLFLTPEETAPPPILRRLFSAVREPAPVTAEASSLIETPPVRETPMPIQDFRAPRARSRAAEAAAAAKDQPTS